MTEQLTKWKPIQGLSARYYIESISDTINELQILLFDDNDEEKKVLVSFKNSIISYESTYESFRSKLISDLDDQYGTKFYGTWTFFKVTNSSYLQWVSKHSYDTTKSLFLTHFCIIGLESIVDIIATDEPQVTLINYPERR